MVGIGNRKVEKNIIRAGILDPTVKYRLVSGLKAIQSITDDQFRTLIEPKLFVNARKTANAVALSFHSN